jgi:hypothetical protein
MRQAIRNVILSVVIAATGSTAPTVNADSPYTMIDLGTLGGCCSYAYGINEQGDVVGTSATAGPNARVPLAGGSDDRPGHARRTLQPGLRTQ